MLYQINFTTRFAESNTTDRRSPPTVRVATDSEVSQSYNNTMEALIQKFTTAEAIC
jgi:hypothetical protein